MMQNFSLIFIWQTTLLFFGTALLSSATMVWWQCSSANRLKEPSNPEPKAVVEDVSKAEPRLVVSQPNLEKLSQQAVTKYRRMLVGTMEPIPPGVDPSKLVRTAKVAFKTTLKATTQTVRLSAMPHKR